MPARFLRPPSSGGRAALALSLICHPERNDPIFSFALNSGASGREVEGSASCFLLCAFYFLLSTFCFVPAS
jgi:hypothetical protein